MSVRNKILFLGFLCSCIGIILASITRGWIIIQLPTRLTVKATMTEQNHECSLWLLTPQGWHNEKELCLLTDDTATSLTHLVKAWATLMYEEKRTLRPLQLASVLIDQQNCAHFSFEQTPFTNEQSIRDRWFLVESLLRTIRENVPTITSVMLLVGHKPLVDRCLDFSKSWPIQGFFS